jgi:hypothetical protein
LAFAPRSGITVSQPHTSQGSRVFERRLYVARLARRPLARSEEGFIATLTRCCAKNAEFAAACFA